MDNKTNQALADAQSALASAATHVANAQSLFDQIASAFTASAGTVAGDAAAVVGQVETGVINTLDAAIAAKQDALNTLSEEYDLLQKQAAAGLKVDASKGKQILDKMKMLVAEASILKTQANANAVAGK